MENDIIDSLIEIKYEGKLKEIDNLEKALDGGPKNVDFTELVSFLCKELKTICNLEEEVNAITSPEDSSAFLMELSSFLKEMGCPYESLTSGHLSDRLSSRNDKLTLLDFLLSELMAARMIKVTQPDADKELSLKINESDTARALKNLLLTLQFNKPPPNITSQQLFQKIESKIKELLAKNASKLIGKPAFAGTLSQTQWDNLNLLQQSMNDDYTIRREMLIKRLDVTIQSFLWSDKMKGKDQTIQNICKKRSATKIPEVDVSDILVARDDITIIEKTSSASVRKNTQSSVNKVMIGQVPDRGGRPNEQPPPPPEVPSWQQNRGGGGNRGGNRGGGNRGRGSSNQQGQGYGGNPPGQGYGGNPSGQGYGGNPSGQGYGGNPSGQGYGGRSQGYQDNRGDNAGRNYGGGGYNRGGGYSSQGGTYADQYVQDNNRNRESGNSYNRGGRGRGNSNYNRGGYR